jgi:ATP-dependent Lon protease
VIVKTAAGFLNADGGTLLIGVSDSGIVTGIQRDLGTLGKRQDLDGYQQFLRNLLNNGLGKDRCAQVKIDFASVDGEQVAVLRVPAAERPAFAQDGGGSAFYVRSGNTTQSLDIEQAHKYIADHFR